MKISEKLAVIKRQEGELMRTYELRDVIAKQSFKENVLLSGKETSKELEARQKKFVEGKKSKVEECNKKIETLKSSIIDGKNNINKKNVEIGLDKKLAEIKYLRIELSKLMNLIKNDSYSSSLNVDVFETLGIASRIKELEEQKQKLDNEIQKINWLTDI
jgi:hypothetical protein